MSSSARSPFGSPPLAPPSPPTGLRTRIVIVGAGSAGIGALLGLLDLPQNVKDGWSIRVYEKQAASGGVWLPDPSPVPPPGLPNSPLYPLLKTNTPVPTMSFPNLPFAPNTPLYPLHHHIQSYHASVIETRKLKSYFNFSSEVARADWNPRTQTWDLVIKSAVDGSTRREEAEHLIVANGHYKYPKEPIWEGVEDWKTSASEGDRLVKHSLWYRGAEELVGRTSIVVGFGASGWDIARQALEFADEVYHSFDPPAEGSPHLPPIPGTITKPRISHFTPTAVHFVDGSKISTVKVTIFLATGYQVLAPFLSADLVVAPHPAPSSVTKLATNGRYIRPLHLDLFAAGDADMPVDRLSFVGIGWFVAAAANAYAQGLYVGHAIAQHNFLPSHEEVLKEVEEREQRVRDAGFEPFQIGHKFTSPGQAEAYQNNLVRIIRARSKFRLPAYLGERDFVEPWRAEWRGKGIKLGLTWLKAVEKGVAEEARFTSQDGTEEDWVRAMETLEAWGEAEEIKDAAAIAGLEFVLG